MIELLSDVTADICFQLRVNECVSFVSTFESFFENPSPMLQIPNPKAIEFMSNRCFQQKTFYVIAKLFASFTRNFSERQSFNFFEKINKRTLSGIEFIINECVNTTVGL